MPTDYSEAPSPWMNDGLRAVLVLALHFDNGVASVVLHPNTDVAFRAITDTTTGTTTVETGPGRAITTDRARAEVMLTAAAGLSVAAERMLREARRQERRPS